MQQHNANIASINRAVNSFGHLVTLGTTLPFDRFAARIRKHCSDPRAQELAEVVSRTQGRIKRGILGRYSAQWVA